MKPSSIETANYSLREGFAAQGRSAITKGIAQVKQNTRSDQNFNVPVLSTLYQTPHIRMLSR